MPTPQGHHQLPKEFRIEKCIRLSGLDNCPHYLLCFNNVEADHCATWRLPCSSLKVLPEAPCQLQKLMVLKLLVEDEALKRPLWGSALFSWPLTCSWRLNENLAGLNLWADPSDSVTDLKLTDWKKGKVSALFCLGRLGDAECLKQGSWEEEENRLGKKGRVSQIRWGQAAGRTFWWWCSGGF